MIKILHLSDLHFDGIPFWVGSLKPRSGLRTSQKWPSMRGHDERVVDDFTIFWEKLKKKHPDLKIVITGDLTRCGGGNDFGNSHRYVHASWNIKKPYHLQTGLKSNCERAFTVPGNHDFWNQIPLNPLLKRSVIDSHFWELPWVSMLKEGRMEIHLIGLDSCSGLFQISLKQSISIGAISLSQLKSGKKLLKQAKIGAKSRNINLILRVAMIHHPQNNLDQNSRNNFLKWLKDLDVTFVMTGHEHIADTPTPRLPPPYQLQCGTTMQAGTRTKLPGKAPNHFFLHTIERIGENSLEIIWKTFEWQHNGATWINNPNNPVWQKSILGIRP